MTIVYCDKSALVSVQWLSEHLTDARLCIFDCSMHLVADSDDSPYRVVSGFNDYQQSHIPGAAYIDLQADLSDPESPYRFTLPPVEQLQARLSALGIGDDAFVVLYSRGSMQWATRIWWMLRCAGFDNAAVLDGGWQQWCAAGLPVASGIERYPPATLEHTARPHLFCDRQAVQHAADDNNTVVINALSAELHAGQSARYGRRGRIPGSVNVPAGLLQDNGGLLPAEQASRLFRAAGVKKGQNIIIYCGGGIAATLDAFVLHQLGYDNISVYDNSLNEWAQDASLPMECSVN